MVDRFLLAVAAPDVASTLGLSDGGMGFMLGSAYAAAAVPLGLLADRGWRRPLLIGGVVLWSAASLLTGLCRSPGELVAARMALGLGQAAFVPAALSLLFDAAPTGAPARLSTFTAGASVGRSTALLGGGAVLAAIAALGLGVGWRSLFVVTAVPNLILIAALCLRSDLNGHGRETFRRSSPSASGWQLACFLLGAVAPIIAGQAIGNLSPSLLARTLALSPAEAGVLAGSVALIAGPTGQLLGGWLAARWTGTGRSPLLIVVAGLWAGVPALAMTTIGVGPIAAVAGLALLNLLLGVASFAALWGWQALVPPAARAVGNGGFMATITLVGVGAGPLLAGVLSDWRGGGGAGLGMALLLVATGAALLASLAALLARYTASPVRLAKS